jgi:hypothetical protein
MKLPAPAYRQAGTRRGLPRNVDMIIGSALTPVLESVAALPAHKAGRPANLPVNTLRSGKPWLWREVKK